MEQSRSGAEGLIDNALREPLAPCRFIEILDGSVGHVKFARQRPPLYHRKT